MKINRREFLGTASVAGVHLYAQANPVWLGKPDNHAQRDSAGRTIFENDYVRYVLGPGGQNLHFIDKRSGRDYCQQTPASSFARVKVAGREHDASSVSVEGDRLKVSFGECQVTALIETTVKPHYLLFKVLSVEGAEVESFTFVDLPLTLQGRAGESFAGCALALNLKTEVVEIPGPSNRLRATCYNRFGLVGAQVALIGCAFGDLRRVMQEVVGAAPELPHSPLGGPWAWDASINRGSYLIDTHGNVSEKTVEDWIKLARSLGFTQIDLHPGHAFRFGDYAPNPEVYPHGLAGVKEVVDKLHAAGLQAGLHTYAQFIDKRTPWVTPVPDPRLGKDATFTLAQPLNADATVVAVVETTKAMSTIIGFQVRNSVTLQIDDELITYTGVVKESPFAFTGCQRGANGTRVAPHAPGAKVHHLKECFGLLLPDGDSTLYAEVAARTAEAFNAGGFDMIYLDALDGSDLVGGGENAWYYQSKFTFEIWKRLKKPALMEMSTFSHHLWFVRSRLPAWDAGPRGGKTLIDIHCLANEGMAANFLPPHLGWWAIFDWAAVQPERTFPDDIEYLCCKALAHDCGFSFIEGFSPETVAKSHNLQRLAALIQRYEKLRRSGSVPVSIRKQLSVAGRDFRLEETGGKKWRFRPVEYARHKVDVTEGSKAWTVENRFGSQPLRVRIEILMSVGPYEAPDNLLLADFGDPGDFTVKRSQELVTNSLTSVSAPVKAGSRSGCFAAKSDYPQPESAWTMAGKAFTANVDLTNRGLGVWIHGDGRGEILNLQLENEDHISNAICDHFVPVDFKGWRYFEFVEPDSDRLADYGWPYSSPRFDWEAKKKRLMSSVYPLFINWTDYSRVRFLNLWFSNLPKENSVECYLSPIKALPLQKVKLKNPAIRVGGRTLTFPIELESGCYLEFHSLTDCRAFDARGEVVAELNLSGQVPLFAAGSNDVEFHYDSSTSASPRVRVTLISEGGPI